MNSKVILKYLSRFSIVLLILSRFQLIFAADSDTSRLKLVFAGDIMGHDAQIQSAWNSQTGSYNYDTCFYFIRDYLHQADVALANLEVTLAGEPFKGYPLFSSPDELADAVRDAGFNVMVTANNHSMDRSKAGLERTIRVLDTKGIIHTGTFYDSEHRDKKYPLIIEKNNIRLAILNYTYGTNGIPVIPPNIVNLIDTIRMAEDLRKAKIAEPDFIIVTIHWGVEYARNESREQQNLAMFLFRHGADAIIGSHPHVVQPVREYYNGSGDTSQMKLVAYSLGNFISNQRRDHTDGGILFQMNLEKTGNTTRIDNYSWLPVWVYRPGSPGDYTYILLPGSEGETYKELYNMSREDREAFDFFLKETDIILN